MVSTGLAPSGQQRTCQRFESKLSEQEYCDGLEKAAPKAPNTPAGADSQDDGGVSGRAGSDATPGGGGSAEAGQLGGSLFQGSTWQTGKRRRITRTSCESCGYTALRIAQRRYSASVGKEVSIAAHVLRVLVCAARARRCTA